jgi:hypothetical protein
MYFFQFYFIFSIEFVNNYSSLVIILPLSLMFDSKKIHNVLSVISWMINFLLMIIVHKFNMIGIIFLLFVPCSCMLLIIYNIWGGVYYYIYYIMLFQFNHWDYISMKCTMIYYSKLHWLKSYLTYLTFWQILFLINYVMLKVHV